MPLGTPLGLAQRKRASPRVEAGTSGLLSVSDSDLRVPAELGQESQASSCLRKGTPLASRVAVAFSSYDGDLSLPLGLALGLKPTDYEPSGNSPSREAAQTPASAISKWGLVEEAQRGQGGAAGAALQGSGLNTPSAIS